MKFEKQEPVKFISHLDLSRAFERAFRRAALPLAFSKGFTPRPKISFSTALPVGTTSSGEYMDVEFNANISPEEVMYRLNAVLPMGIKILKAARAEDKPDLSLFNGARYKVLISGIYGKQDLERAINSLLNMDQILVTKVTKKKTRQIDIAPLIYNISLKKTDEQKALLEMELATGQEGNLVPTVVVTELSKLLDVELEIEDIHREDLFLKRDENKIYPL